MSVGIAASSSPQPLEFTEWLETLRTTEELHNGFFRVSEKHFHKMKAWISLGERKITQIREWSKIMDAVEGGLRKP